MNCRLSLVENSDEMQVGEVGETIARILKSWAQIWHGKYTICIFVLLRYTMNT